MYLTTENSLFPRNLGIILYMTESPEHMPKGRARLIAVLRLAGDVVHISDAEQALQVDRTQAAKLLSRWAAQGWMRRVGSGAYVPVQLDLLDAGQVVQDPWILIPALFSPCYVGGRTAAEHWDLTEQIFRDIFVFSARTLRSRTVERQGAIFTLKHTKQEMIFGTKTLWRDHTRVLVSDVHRTVIDMLDDPATGGGIQHVDDCFLRYAKRPDYDPDSLLAYAKRHGNGAIFKRLGFLAERHGLDKLAAGASRNLTAGNTKLDPALACPRLVSRWHLRVPQSWIRGAAA